MMSENTVIRNLIIHGESIEKLYSVVPSEFIKTGQFQDLSYEITYNTNYNLEAVINGKLFKGKYETTMFYLDSGRAFFDRGQIKYIQKIALKAYSHGMIGGKGIRIILNFGLNANTGNAIRLISNKYKCFPMEVSLHFEHPKYAGDSFKSDLTEVYFYHFKEIAIPSFVDFLEELQNLERLREEKRDESYEYPFKYNGSSGSPFGDDD